jgi:hypothetical protein
MALDRVALDPVSDALVGARMISVIFIRVFIGPTPNTAKPNTADTDTNADADTDADNKMLRCVTLHKINPTWTDVLNTRAMKIYEVYNTDENIGPAPAGACSKPKSQLPASWISSCKSKGRMKRTGDRKQKIGGKTQKVAGKRIKGKKYGGPLPDYSA